MLPIMLLLGPCGCGKGTLATRLIITYNLHHLSVGDWLRSQAQALILGITEDRINEHVSQNLQIPDTWLTQAYGSDWQEHAPPALVLYVCSKANVSTPSSMWIRAMAVLKRECEIISASSKAKAILLVNFPKTIAQSNALDRCFRQANLPNLAVLLTCPADINLERFVSRSRGNNDAKTFERRLKRFDEESPAVIEK